MENNFRHNTLRHGRLLLTELGIVAAAFVAGDLALLQQGKEGIAYIAVAAETLVLSGLSALMDKRHNQYISEQQKLRNTERAKQVSSTLDS